MKLIQVANSNVQNLEQGDIINLGTIDRKIICGDMNAFLFNGTEITLNRTGFYQVDVTANVEISLEDITQIQLIENNVPNETAYAAENALASNVVNLKFSKIIRVFPNNCQNQNNLPTTLSIKNAGAKGKIISINVSVTKVG